MNRAERRAIKFQHNGGGMQFSMRSMKGNKGLGKVKQSKRVNIDGSTQPWMLDKVDKTS